MTVRYQDLRQDDAADIFDGTATGYYRHGRRPSRLVREIAPSRRWEFRLINAVRALGWWLYCKADDQRVKRDPDYIPF